MTRFSRRVFVPDGLRIVDRIKWNGKALVFTQDYPFTSPSTPASIVLSRNEQRSPGVERRAGACAQGVAGGWFRVSQLSHKILE